MNNKQRLVLTVNSVDDLKLLQDNTVTEYINININNPSKEIVDYFISNGQKYYYSDAIDNINGYIYVDYDTFKKGQEVVDTIIYSIPDDLNEIEKCKYLYHCIGKIITYDINTLSDKNDAFNYNKLNTINNIWGCLSNLKGTNISYVKLFFYLCRLVNINNEIVRLNDYSYLGNKINIDNSNFITDITKDIPFIQAKYKTRFFGNYNDDIELDKKVKYIRSNYSEIMLDNSLKKLNYNSDNILKLFLEEFNKVINVSSLGGIELGIILDIVLKKYLPSNHIAINNLYTIDIYNTREHFILISDSSNHYSYNYKQNMFLSITTSEIEKNINLNKIGIYLNEIIPNINIKKIGK